MTLEKGIEAEPQRILMLRELRASLLQKAGAEEEF